MSEQALSERPPTENEVRAASEAARLLAKALTPAGLPISVEKNGDQFQLELPAPLGQLMLDVLTHVGRGEMITLVPYGAELTTKEAADLLNVSRPFLVKLLDDGSMEISDDDVEAGSVGTIKIRPEAVNRLAELVAQHKR